MNNARVWVMLGLCVVAFAAQANGQKGKAWPVGNNQQCEHERDAGYAVDGVRTRNKFV